MTHNQGYWMSEWVMVRNYTGWSKMCLSEWVSDGEKLWWLVQDVSEWVSEWVMVRDYSGDGCGSLGLLAGEKLLTISHKIPKVQWERTRPCHTGSMVCVFPWAFGYAHIMRNSLAHCNKWWIPLEAGTQSLTAQQERDTWVSLPEWAHLSRM